MTSAPSTVSIEDVGRESSVASCVPNGGKLTSAQAGPSPAPVSGAPGSGTATRSHCRARLG